MGGFLLCKWERWNSLLPDGSINPGQMTSFNHYALGSVCAFLHKYVAGLSCLEPGWKAALVAPKPGGTVTSAETRFEAPTGAYAVKWWIDFDAKDHVERTAPREGEMVLDVEVPPNGRARVVAGKGKAGVDQWVGSGMYSFKVPYEEDRRWYEMEVIQGVQGNAIESHFVP
jgi:alpha-L-rhamnosidase